MNKKQIELLKVIQYDLNCIERYALTKDDKYYLDLAVNNLDDLIKETKE
jgi:hypothetical protein